MLARRERARVTTPCVTLKNGLFAEECETRYSGIDEKPFCKGHKTISSPVDLQQGPCDSAQGRLLDAVEDRTENAGVKAFLTFPSGSIQTKNTFQFADCLPRQRENSVARQTFFPSPPSREVPDPKVY